MNQNILTSNFKTPFETAPFSKIENEHFLPAFKIAIKETRLEIDAIVNNPEDPTFQNTIEALDFSGEQLDRISSIFFNLNSAETNDEIHELSKSLDRLRKSVKILMTKYRS